jgi:hypothetical protein
MTDSADRMDTVPETTDDRGRLWTAPASFLQEQWFNSVESHLSNYNVVVAWKVAGKLDRSALRNALSELTLRHEILRTSLGACEGTVQQHIMRSAEPQLWHVDLSSTESPETELRQVVLADAGRPFALGEPPLWRVILARLGTDLHVLTLILHHAVCDAWSSAVLERDLAALYQACVTGTDPRLPEMAIQFGDYAAWERSFRDPVLEAEWRDRLTPLPSPPSIPFSDGRAFSQRPFDIICHPLPTTPPGTARRLLLAAQQQNGTLATAVYAASVISMAPGEGGEVVIGTAHANRGAREVQQLIGPVFDYVPLRVSLEGQPTFTELIRRVRDEEGAARERKMPLRCVENAVRERADLAGRGVFDIIINLIPGQRKAAVPGNNARCADIQFVPYPISNNWMRIRAERDFYGAGQLSYVVRSGPADQIAGHLYGHGSALPWHRLSRLGAAFSAALVRLGEDPQLRAADIEERCGKHPE